MKNLNLRMTEEEINFLITTVEAKADEAAENGDISRCCDIRLIAQKIQSAAKLA